MSAPRIFCWPDRPGENLLLFHIAKAAGWQWVDRPGDADLRFLHRDTTWILPGDAHPWETESVGWINGRCRDISKSRVSRLVTETMGYPLEVDPTTFTGMMVRKSDRNFTKDVTLVQGPTDEVVTGKIYQRLVDSRIGPNTLVNHRVLMIGNRAISVTVQHWMLRGKWRIMVDPGASRFVEPGDVFTVEELASLARFCRAFGLDYGTIDVVRDKEDGRIAVVDANNTPGDGPLSKGEVGERFVPRMVAAFHEQFCITPTPTGPS